MVLVVAVAGAILAAAGAALTARVHGSSMTPALRDGDVLLVDRVGVRLQPARRGDIVVTAEPGGGSLVKRVIAVPGDVVEIDPAIPAVLLQPGGRGPWQRLVEPYVGASWRLRAACCDSRGLSVGGGPQPLRVPPEHYFLLGDNRDVSTDSRRFGLFTADQIAGRVLVRWWPVDRAGQVAGRASLVAA